MDPPYPQRFGSETTNSVVAEVQHPTHLPGAFRGHSLDPHYVGLHRPQHGSQKQLEEYVASQHDPEEGFG